MSLFKKFFSKTEDSEMDFAASELQKEKNTGSQDENIKSKNFSSKEKDKHNEKEDDIKPETVKNLLKSVMESLDENPAAQKILKGKLDDDDGFRNVHVKTTNSFIIKDGKHIYESSTGDSKVTDAVNDLFDEIFNKNHKK